MTELGQPSARESAIDAAVHLVGRRGYAATSLEEILSSAGLTRAEFEGVFADKEECFLAAHGQLAYRLFLRVQGAASTPGAFPTRMAAGLRTLARSLASTPLLTKAATVQLTAMGSEGLARRRTILEPYLSLVEQLLGETGFAPDLPESIPRLAVGGVATAIFDEILGGRTGELETKVPKLLFALLLPLSAGPQGALAEMERAGIGLG